LAVKLTAWVDRNFISSGGFRGGWAPLARSTLRQKERKGYSLKPLITTGAALTLQRSFLAFWTDAVAGIGTEVPYSIHHERGGTFLPQRPMLPTRDQAGEMAIGVYNFFVQQARAKAQI
jgi:phage gpG-like protein